MLIMSRKLPVKWEAFLLLRPSLVDCYPHLFLLLLSIGLETQFYKKAEHATHRSGKLEHGSWLPKPTSVTVSTSCIGVILLKHCLYYNVCRIHVCICIETEKTNVMLTKAYRLESTWWSQLEQTHKISGIYIAVDS